MTKWHTKYVGGTVPLHESVDNGRPQSEHAHCA